MAQHCWSLEEDLVHGDSSDLDVIGEKNVKMFDERYQLAICAELKIEQKLSTIYTYASYTKSLLNNMINIANMVYQDVCPHHSPLALFSPFSGAIFVCMQLRGEFDVPRTNKWIVYIRLSL